MAHQVGWLLTSGDRWVSDGMNAARRSQSVNNLKQIGLGLDNYHEAHKTFPPGGTFDECGRPMHGWQTMILPAIEQVSLYNQINLDVPWDDRRNSTSFQTSIGVYLNPGIRAEEKTDGLGYVLSHYSGNAECSGLMPCTRSRTASRRRSWRARLQTPSSRGAIRRTGGTPPRASTDRLTGSAVLIRVA